MLPRGTHKREPINSSNDTPKTPAYYCELHFDSTIEHYLCMAYPSAEPGFTSAFLCRVIHACRKRLSIFSQTWTENRFLRPIFANRERYYRESHGFELNYAASYWDATAPPASCI